VKLTRVLAASGLAAVLLPVPASPAAADSEGLDLVVPFVAPMLPGQQGWVGAIWEADDDVCNVQVTASAPSVGDQFGDGDADGLVPGASVQRHQQERRPQDQEVHL
jgi:hypothetical protein